MCDEDHIELCILLPVKFLGFGMAKSSLKYRIPPFAVCSMSDVHHHWKYSLIWACSLCLSSHWCCTGGSFTYSNHPESTNTHASALSGFCSDPNELISSNPHLVSLIAFSWPFYWGVCSQNKQCCFPRGGMCEWQWNKDMETLNRKLFGLSGNICYFICFQVAQFPRLLLRCYLICCNSGCSRGLSFWHDHSGLSAGLFCSKLHWFYLGFWDAFIINLEKTELSFDALATRCLLWILFKTCFG